MTGLMSVSYTVFPKEWKMNVKYIPPKITAGCTLNLKTLYIHMHNDITIYINIYTSFLRPIYIYIYINLYIYRYRQGCTNKQRKRSFHLLHKLIRLMQAYQKLKVFSPLEKRQKIILIS